MANDSDSNITYVALAIALAALIIALGQLLTQIFATAEGYRRCQASVMGGWAKKTRRRFRWAEFRFETLYSIPRFGLTNHRTEYVKVLSTKDCNYTRGAIPLDGTLESMHWTFCGPGNVRSDSFELVSWISFLKALHGNSRQLLNTHRTLDPRAFTDNHKYNLTGDQYAWCFSMPDVKIQQRSWDFMASDAVRPLAVVGLSDIAVMARRLGMVWKEFDLTEGNLRAEGNGHTITSTIVRSIGTVLQINVRDNAEKKPREEIINELFIPSTKADKCGFGILQGQNELLVPDYKIGTIHDIYDLLNRHVDPSRDAYHTLKGIYEANSGWTPGISDIIGFAAPMMRHPHQTLVRIPSPASYEAGLTKQQEGFVVFHHRLHDLVVSRGSRVSDQTRLILQQYEELKLRYGDQWENELICNLQLNDRSVEFLDDLHKRHDETTRYFMNLQDRFGSAGEKGHFFRYTDLMYSHIKFAVNYSLDASNRLHENKGRDTYGMRVTRWVTEGAHIYFDNIENEDVIIKEMRDRGFDRPEIVEEAWLTMMWRAFLWHRCHYMVEGNRVPSQHWGSRIPVYIG